MGRISAQRFLRLMARCLASQSRKIPYVVNIEVTNRCNAKCAHCFCWRSEPGSELGSYAGLVEKFRPCIVWITGGEPLLRLDLVQIIKDIRKADRHLYLGLSTNGSLLDSWLGRQLLDAGLDQVNISLDFVGTQHNAFRGLERLYEHIEEVVPELRNIGLKVVLTCCIMRQNIDMLLTIARVAESWGVQVGYSCYSRLKIGGKANDFTPNQIDRLRHTIETLSVWKRKQNVIKSSFSYLRTIPEFFTNGSIGGCQATRTWLYVTPDGYLKICPDKPWRVHFNDYRGFVNTGCGACWYTCRGEMETPIMERLMDEIRTAVSNKTAILNHKKHSL